MKRAPRTARPSPAMQPPLVTQHDSNGKITALNLSGELSPAFSMTD